MERFKNRRLITRGVKSNIPERQIHLLWNLIDNMEIKDKDTHQFFTLSRIGETGRYIQVIEHMQEQPEYHSPVMYYPTEYCYEGKVYVIDDGSASVMCLPQER